MTTATDIISEKNPTLAFELALENKSEGTLHQTNYTIGAEPICFLHGAHSPAIVDLESWVKKAEDRQLYILDADWAPFLAFDQAVNILQDERIKCYGESGDHHFNEMAWSTLFKKCQFIGLKSNSDQVREKLFEMKSGVELSFAD